MAIKINEIKVKNRQNLIVIPNVGSFKFVEYNRDNPVGCYECDLRSLGVCAVIPCTMSYRSDYKDGVFKSLNI